MSAWSPMPLAEAILANRYAPPVLLLAAYRCKHMDDPRELTGLAYLAANKEKESSDVSERLS